MLIEFRVENHRSIRDEQALSLKAGRFGASDDPIPRKTPGCSDKLLPVTALYGANASGKSNVIAALTFMRDAVSDSQRLWSPDEGIRRDPFAWGPKRNEPSLYEVDFICNGVRYFYGFRLDDRAILEEWLFAWPNGKKQTWFERDGESFQHGKSLLGENKVIEGVTRKNALFLSAAAQFKHQQLTPLFSWFSSIRSINVVSRWPPRFRAGSESVVRLLMEADNDARQLDLGTGLDGEDESSSSLLFQFVQFIKNADVGIIDMRLNKNVAQATRYKSSGLELKHQFEAEAWLPLEEESRGTRTLFQLALPILRTIQRGGILVVDELEASMHPNLAEHIIRQFNDPQTNPRNAQLIFSTHDTNLLGTLSGSPALRRDEVWLTEKDEQGATVLYPLTDFKPRNDENIERGYVQGRYGAIPHLCRI